MNTRSAIRVIGPSIAYLVLSRGLYALIDSEDAERCECCNWCATQHQNGKHYAKNGSQQYLHQFITGFRETDHRNGVRLDCRKCNLRDVTRRQNSTNSCRRSDNASGFKGVSWCANAGAWRAQIVANGKYKHLGLFDSAEAAHIAYTRASVELHGEFSRVA